MIKIILKSGKDEAVKRFHPWIFSGAIKEIKGSPVDGSLVSVFDYKDNFLAQGFYHNSSIAVRVISYDEKEIDYNFWKNKFLEAYNYRVKAKIINNSNFNVYRLIHAEGDGLPGLIVDYYNGHLVIQCHTYAMFKHINIFADILKDMYGSGLKSVFDKSSETLPKEFRSDNKLLFGSSDNCEVNEYGHRFYIDYVEGQKTGFFIDQRENRKLLNQYCEGKNVLNTFCYSGGFSIYALKAGAALVHSVDSSKKAINTLEKNIVLNGFENAQHKAYCSDTFDFLKNTETTYDIIVLDPPAYAKHKDVKHNAIQGYKRLNQEALQKINKGGFLFTFSCSQVVDNSLFKSTVISAAINAKRNVRIVHQITQPTDHPINAFHQEGEYLKGLVLFVS